MNYYINNRPLPIEFKLAGYKPKQWTPVDSLLDWLKPFEAKEGLGSNNWVVSGKFTENGKPMLANDPPPASDGPTRLV